MHKSSLISVAWSILVRLPRGFLIPFIVLAVGWTLLLFKELSKLLMEISRTLAVNSFPFSRLDDILAAMIVVAVYFAGLLVAYNLSVLIHSIFARYGSNPVRAPEVRPHRPTPQSAASDRFRNVDKIGIVLAGGGAKGAFQAGAMKGIYRFLAEHDALDKVKVISGTSIGSWNALFWLADLIKSDKGWDEPSVHENWWRSIRLSSLVAPSWYMPGFRNAFFVTTPWQQSFEDIFGQDEVRQRISESKIHFYFTHSNVRSGKLECTTNNEQVSHIPKVKYKWLDPSSGADKCLQRLKFGVFASMDLPPLFPYMEMDDNYFEDGGVVDNLPVMFAAMEQCDLIFVLPLNSDFNAIPDHRSVLNRFLRVMDVRQGALERNSLKGLYLYNELAVLRNHVRAIETEAREAGIEFRPIEMSDTLTSALNRTHQQTRIFAVCPLRTFAESTINTHELWKNKEAGFAFGVMYRETTRVLNQHFNPEQERIKIALVNEGGGITWDEDF
jgi:NTE family protein